VFETTAGILSDICDGQKRRLKIKKTLRRGKGCHYDTYGQAISYNSGIIAGICNTSKLHGPAICEIQAVLS
jgi:hypothetical protein